MGDRVKENCVKNLLHSTILEGETSNYWPCSFHLVCWCEVDIISIIVYLCLWALGGIEKARSISWPEGIKDS